MTIIIFIVSLIYPKGILRIVSVIIPPMSRKSKPATLNDSPFTLYVMGKNEAAFEEFIFTLLQGHLPELQASDLTTRLSRDGNYISVRAVIQIDSKEQIDSIYRELYKHKRVLMAL